MTFRTRFGCLLAVAALACSPPESESSPAPNDTDETDGGNSSSAGAPSPGGTTSGSTNGGSPSNAGLGATGGAFASGGSGMAGSPRGGASSAGEGGAAGNSGRQNGGSDGAGTAGNGGAAGSPATAGASTRPDPIPVNDLPIIEEMPDPLIMNDGTPVTTPEQWQLRRREMIELLEDYTYGRLPPPPGNVTAATVTAARRVAVGNDDLEAEYRMLRLSFGPDEALGFDLGIFTPVVSTEAEKFPILIALASSANDRSIGAASAALARGYAVATVPYQQLGADAATWASTGFFPSYPDYDWRDFAAWAWGLSRAVDYLVTDASVNADQIMITGVSRLGQAVLLAGALDERIALSAPVAGGMAFRFSGEEMGGGLGQGITEIVDQNTYWFGPRLPEFRNRTPRLPSDQHWLLALTAPRLFIMCNSLSDQYGRAYAAVQTYLSAKPVYQFLLGSDQNLGLHFREGGHGMTAEDWSALLDFADQYLLKKAGTRKFDVLPPDDRLP